MGHKIAPGRKPHPKIAVYRNLRSRVYVYPAIYYDAAAAAASGVDEDDLHDDHEFVEHSSVEEVMEWCAGSE